MATFSSFRCLPARGLTVVGLSLVLLIPAVPARASAAPNRIADSLRAVLRQPALPDTQRVVVLAKLATAINRTDLPEAERLARQAVALTHRLHYLRGEVRALNALAATLFYSGDYVQAQTYFTQLLAAAKAAGEPFFIGHANLGLGNVVTMLGDYERGADYHARAYHAYETCSPLPLKDAALALTNRGSDLINLGRVAEARAAIIPALRLARQSGNSQVKILALINFGRLQSTVDHPDSAAVTWRQAQLEAHAAADRLSESISLIDQADANLDMHHPAQALPLLHEAAQIARHAQGRYELWNALILMANTMHQLGLPAAFDTLRASQQVGDEIAGEKRRKAIAQLQVKLDVAQQQARIKDLSQQLEIRELRRKQQWALTVALVVLVLAAAAGLLWWYRRRQQRHELALRTRLAADLHDDVGSLLSQISMQSALIRDGLYNPDQQRSRLADVVTACRNAVGLLNDVVWALDAHNDPLPNLLDRMRDHAYEVLQPAEIEARFDVAADLPMGRLPVLVRRNLYLIFKEALHNVVKHSGATAVRVSIGPQEGLLVMRVEDDGTGPAPTGRSSGHGLRNMERRATEAGGTATCAPAPGGGFRVEVAVPLVHVPAAVPG